jgi:hypothetical protein
MRSNRLHACNYQTPTRQDKTRADVHPSIVHDPTTPSSTSDRTSPRLAICIGGHARNTSGLYTARNLVVFFHCGLCMRRHMTSSCTARCVACSVCMHVACVNCMHACMHARHLSVPNAVYWADVGDVTSCTRAVEAAFIDSCNSVLYGLPYSIRYQSAKRTACMRTVLTPDCKLFNIRRT